MYHCSRLSQKRLLGICIILCVSAEFLAVQSDDGEVTLVGEFGSMDGLPSCVYRRDLLLDHLGGDPQQDLPVARRPGWSVPRDLVSEELGHFVGHG